MISICLLYLLLHLDTAIPVHFGHLLKCISTGSMLRSKGDRRLFDSGLKPPFVSLTKSEDMKMMDWHTYRQKFMRNTILAVYLRRFVVRRWLRLPRHYVCLRLLERR